MNVSTVRLLHQATLQAHSLVIVDTRCLRVAAPGKWPDSVLAAGRSGVDAVAATPLGPMETEGKPVCDRRCHQAQRVIRVRAGADSACPVIWYHGVSSKLISWTYTTRRNPRGQHRDQGFSFFEKKKWRRGQLLLCLI